MPQQAKSHAERIDQLKRVRAEALEHTRLARALHLERRELMQALLRYGYSQADLARELGVTRQAVQKMLAT